MTEELKKFDNFSQDEILRLQKDSEREILKTMLDANFQTSLKINQFSSWLLVGVGSTLSILIANMESMLNVVLKTNFNICLSLFIFSVLCGVSQKCIFLLVSIKIEVLRILEKKLPEIYSGFFSLANTINNDREKFGLTREDKYISLDNIMALYVAVFPTRFYQKFILKKYNQSKKDPLLLQKQIIKNLLGQSMMLVAQILLVIVGIFFVMP